MAQASTSAAGLASSDARNPTEAIVDQASQTAAARRRPVLTIPIPEEPGPNSGSFRRILRNFALVPAFSVLEFATTFVALLTVPHGSSRGPDWIAIIIALAFWSISHHIGPPLFRLFDLLTELVAYRAWSEALLEALSTLIHVAVKELSRFAAVFILYKAGHPDLIDILWLGFGWALGDVACGIYQNYLHLYQYQEGALPGEEDLSAAPWSRSRAGDIITSASTDGGDPASANEVQEPDYEAILDVELGHLSALKARLELENIYGIPFPDIPPIIISIEWLDALLLSLGLTLVMAHPFIRHGTIEATLPVVTLTWAIHSCLALGYALVMPRIGPHVVNYFGLMVSIGSLIAGLAMWGVLQ